MSPGLARLAMLGAGLAFPALLALDQVGAAYGVLLAGLSVLVFGSGLSANWQIAIGSALGVLLGVWPGSGVELVQPVGRLFISLLKMLIAPMILLSIVHGIAGMAAARDFGRIGTRTLWLYVATMAAAVATGLLAVNLFGPGEGSQLRESAFFQEAIGAYGARGAPPDVDFTSSLVAVLMGAFANPIQSLAEGRILAVVTFAVLLGLALLRIGPAARPLVEVLGVANLAVMTLIGWFVRLAPIGVFALLGHLVATAGIAELAQHLGAFAAVVVGATAFHAFVTLPLFARVLAGVAPLELFRSLQKALLVAFSTSSSAATLPVTTRCVEEELGVPREVSSFVLPLGATVNMDGTALYEAIAAIFVANVYGIELPLASQLVIFLVAMVSAIGAPGIPSAGMVTMVVVLESVGLPAEAVGLLLTIDRVLDTFRTMANVEGDAVVATVVARSRQA